MPTDAFDAIITGRASLVDYWPMDDAASPGRNLRSSHSTQTMAGVSSPTFHAAVADAAVPSITYGVQTLTASANGASAATANGVSAFTSSLEIWYKSLIATNLQYQLLYGAGTSGQGGMLVFIGNTGNVEVWYFVGPAPVYQPGASCAWPTDGKMHQLGIAYQYPSMTIWIDGVQKATTGSLSPSPSAGNSVYLGGGGTSAWPTTGIHGPLAQHNALLTISDFAATLASAQISPQVAPDLDATTVLAAGYVKTQRNRYDRIRGIEYITEYSKIISPAGRSPMAFGSVGASFVGFTVSDAQALAALNAKRRHRYQGAPAAGDGAAVRFLDGTLPILDTT